VYTSGYGRLMEAGGRAGLTREQIVSTALRLLGTGGVRACTVRGIARELRVTPMAIYWHVPDKQGLYDAVLDTVISTVSLGGLPAEPGAALATLARRYRAAFAAHPHAALLLGARPSAGGPAPTAPAVTALGRAGMELLAALGLTGDQLICAYLLVIEFVMGAVLAEYGVHEEPGRPIPDPDTRFEFGLGCLIAGLRAAAADP
jgi:AcrR family transcriptional regulator